jgi:hypothetical protein
MKINKKIIISIFIIFLFLVLPLSVQAANEKKENSTTAGEITADLKVRTLSGEWKDSISSVGIGTVVEFQVTVDIPRDYVWLGVLVELPSISDSPMFNYVTGSISPTILDPDVGITYANDEEVAWNWVTIEPPFTQTMTFKAIVKQSGTQNVNLIVGGLYAENGQTKEDEGSDSLRFSSSKGKNINNIFREKILQILQVIEKVCMKLNKLCYICG